MDFWNSIVMKIELIKLLNRHLTFIISCITRLLYSNYSERAGLLLWVMLVIEWNYNHSKLMGSCESIAIQ